NGGKGQERLRVSRRPFLGRSTQRSGVLEFQSSLANMLQPGRRAQRAACPSGKNAVGAGGPLQSRDTRSQQGFGQGEHGTGGWLVQLYDVTAGTFIRRRRTLASASDVLSVPRH